LIHFYKRCTKMSKVRYTELSIVTLVLAITFSVIHSPWIGLLVGVPAWFIASGHEFFYLAYHTLGRDLQTIYRFLKVLLKTFGAKYRNRSVSDKFIYIAKANPNQKMITFCSETGDTSLTFMEALNKSCQVARYFQSKGYKKGDVVALVLENRIEYCCYWLGLSMLGVVPALINSNLKKEGLLHTITIVNSRAVIYSSETEPVILEALEGSDTTAELFCVDQVQKENKGIDLSSFISKQSTQVLDKKYAGYNDDLFYIYTSGTTGLPKAAVIKNSRFMFAVYALFCMTKILKDDVLYSPLPMYHTAAGAMVTGNAVLEGISIVSRKKFSASNYWKDCCRNNVTCGQYIGEIARYLYSTPKSPFDTQHKIRMMFGNGLRLEIWEKFVNRFKVGMIHEFYGSTEGNCSVGNISGRVGAVGFVSVLFPFLLPLGLIQVDEETREPIRDENGMCIPCKTGTPGEIVGRIDKGHPVRDFHGYADKAATKKKILTDVWKKGDMCFRSGDVLEMDEFGWLYFKDRAGDTFRWKGENVSTTEVEAVCSSIVALKDCIVYGVEIPGCEGKAGMITIPDPNRQVDLGKFLTDVETRLPAYSRPLFVRIVDEVELTATFKLKKKDLQREGFDKSLVKDPLYIYDQNSRQYKELTEDIYRDIHDGKLRF